MSDHLQGGETLALKRLDEHLADKKWVVQFEKPKGNPAALQPATTVLSPYLKFGCLSVRLFHKRLQEVRHSPRPVCCPVVVAICCPSSPAWLTLAVP